MSNARPEPSVLKLIAAAQAAGLSSYKITKKGREVALEVSGTQDSDADDVAERIERMAAYGSE